MLVVASNSCSQCYYGSNPSLYLTPSHHRENTFVVQVTVLVKLAASSHAVTLVNIFLAGYYSVSEDLSGVPPGYPIYQVSCLLSFFGFQLLNCFHKCSHFPGLRTVFHHGAIINHLPLPPIPGITAGPNGLFRKKYSGEWLSFYDRLTLT